MPKEFLTKEVIDKKLMEYYASKVKKLPHYTNWCSISGHPCPRFLVYLRENWNDVEGLPAEIQPRLDTGTALHKQAEQTFRDAGFYVHTQIDPLVDKDLEISGRMDCEISLDDRKPAPVEVKSTEDYILNKFNKAEDFINSPSWWHKNMLCQLCLYCYIRGKERGILHLRSLKRWKNIEISILDEPVINFINEIIEKLKVVNQCVKDGTLPDRIPYDKNICGRCNAKILCVPDEPLASGEILMDEVFEESLEKRELLKSSAEEFRAIDKIVKDRLRGIGKEKLFIGNFEITGEKRKGGLAFTIKPLEEE